MTSRREPAQAVCAAPEAPQPARKFSFKFAGRVQLYIALCLAVLSLALFYVRGVQRALRSSRDFATLYAAARCWSGHSNPYSQIEIDRAYAAGRGDPAAAPDPQSTASVYPPTAFPVIAMLARLDWKPAKRVWMLVNVALFSSSILLLLGTLPFSSAIGRLIVASSLVSYSPTHSGLALGNPSVAAISLVTIALCARRSPIRDYAAGILLGIACCLKPHVAIPFVLFCSWRGRWRAASSAIAVTLVMACVAVTRLLSVKFWWTAWMDNLAFASAPGHINDPTSVSPFSHLMINFQTIVGLVTANQHLCNVIAWLFVVACGGAILKRARNRNNDWACLSIFILLILLAAYHRYHDLQLLMLCTGTVIQIASHSRSMRAGLVSAMALLWFPLQALASKFMLPPRPGLPLSGLVWRSLTFRHQPLCLFALALLLTTVLCRERLVDKTAAPGAV